MTGPRMPATEAEWSETGIVVRLHPDGTGEVTTLGPGGHASFEMTEGQCIAVMLAIRSADGGTN